MTPFGSLSEYSQLQVVGPVATIRLIYHCSSRRNNITIVVATMNVQTGSWRRTALSGTSQARKIMDQTTKQTTFDQPSQLNMVYRSNCSDAPRPEASALTRMALPGTPAVFSASTIDWARDRPRFSAADLSIGIAGDRIAIASDGNGAVAALGGECLDLVRRWLRQA